MYVESAGFSKIKMKGMESWMLRLHEDLSESNPGQTDLTERTPDSELSLIKLLDESLWRLERGGSSRAIGLENRGQSKARSCT